MQLRPLTFSETTARLESAAALYDAGYRALAPPSPLAPQPAVRWMHAVLGVLRGTHRSPDHQIRPGRLLVGKYLASIASGTATALASVIIALAFLGPQATLGTISTMLLAACGGICFTVGFYVLECQLVFLVPIQYDAPNATTGELLRASRRATVLAGGTARVMAQVIFIAASMLFGGFLRRGFLRSWCTGCIAVCLWYEALHKKALRKNNPTITQIDPL